MLRTEKRLDDMDMVKGVGIILVVIGHSTYVSENTLTWLASFHMPLFFLISGMLFAYRHAEKEKFSIYAKKRFFGMMIPYFWFSLIYIGVDYYYLFAHPELIDQAFINAAVLQAVSFYGISVLWFLPTLFLGELLFYFLIKKCRTWQLAAAGIFSAWAAVPGVTLVQRYVNMEENAFMTWLGNVLLGLLRVFPAVAFLLLGYGVWQLLQRLSIKPLYEVIAGVMLLLFHAAVAFANGRVDLHYLVFHNVLYYYVAACSATFGFLLIFRHVKPLWLLTFLGSNSLIVMLTHLDCQVMSTAIRFAAGMNQFIPRAKDLMFRVNLYGALLIGELVLIVLINRFGFFLIGRKHPVKMQFPGCVERLLTGIRAKRFKRIK